MYMHIKMQTDKLMSVKTVTIDDHVHEDVLFIKVDVEGCEYKAVCRPLCLAYSPFLARLEALANLEGSLVDDLVLPSWQVLENYWKRKRLHFSWLSIPPTTSEIPLKSMTPISSSPTW